MRLTGNGLCWSENGDMKQSESGICAKRHVSGAVEGRGTKSGDRKMGFAIRSVLNSLDYVTI